jgi:tetratricopeptide (TPR) repeat protein
MIRNYRALQPAIGNVPAALRGILSKALDPAPERRFASAEAFAAALQGLQFQASASQPSQPVPADIDATRRTVFASAQKPSAQAPRPQAARKPAARSLVTPLRRAGIATLVAMFLGGVFVIVYEVRMWGNADALRREIDTGRLDMTTARAAYDSLAKQSLFSLPLYPARVSLRDRYSAEADRVIADYREASESTPVSPRDWRRAQTALASAQSLAPDDKTIRGKSRVVDGNLRFWLKDTKGARAAFEEAQTLLPHSPDPHLGLAFLYMREGDLDKAEDELQQAKRNGFRPGRREQRSLGDGYRVRGERWLTSARRAHDIGQMQDNLKHADSDLAHAEDLYNQVAPFLSGAELAQMAANEREGARKLLTQAQQAQGSGPQTVAESR